MFRLDKIGERLLGASMFGFIAPVIATSTPATQQTQQSSFDKLVNSVVSGTVAVIQAARQPTQIYPPATTGVVFGSGTGSTQLQTEQQSVPVWLWFALAGVVLAAVAVAVFRR